MAERIAECASLEPNESPRPPCPAGEIDPLRSDQCNPEAHRFWAPPNDRAPLETPPPLSPATSPTSPPSESDAGPGVAGVANGGLARGLIIDWFRQHRAELACCAATVPGTEGRLTVRFIFGGGRDHPEVSVAESEVDPAVAGCVVGVMSEWVWGFDRACDPCAGQATGWEAVTVGNYPLVFRQQGGS